MRFSVSRPTRRHSRSCIAGMSRASRLERRSLREGASGQRRLLAVIVVVLRPQLVRRVEQITGADRFTLARHFRRAFGTSPDRYRMMRRLELARTAISSGLPLARAAAHVGFADQSHMTRQFKRTYGLTPTRWAVLTAAPYQQRRPTKRRSGPA